MEQLTDSFWNWFKKRNQAYLSINDADISNNDKEKLLDEMLEQLHKYCSNLYFEIGGWPNQDQELIITADGNVDYFDKVEELIKNAPVIDRWTYTAFLQAHDLDYTSNFEDVELKPCEIWFLPLNSKSNAKDIGFRVCIPNYEIIKNSEWLDAAVYRMLDTVLGEKVFALDVKFIEIGYLPDNPEKQGMMELHDLPEFIKWKKAKSSLL